MGIIEAIILTVLGIAIGFILRVIIADNKEYFAETFAELSATKIEGIRHKVEKTCLLCDNIPDIKEDVEQIKNRVESTGESVNELHHRLDDTHISIPVLQKLMSYDRFFKEYKNEDREEYADKFDAPPYTHIGELWTPVPAEHIMSLSDMWISCHCGSHSPQRSFGILFLNILYGRGNFHFKIIILGQ